MNLINKMSQIDKQQVNELVHCKVSLFKKDLIEQLRQLIETDELKLNNLLEFSQLNNARPRLLINKRKFSSSEDDDEAENSNSLESNDKSDSHEGLNLNKILNNWKSSDEEDKKEEDRLVGDLECNEKLQDKDALSIANHHFNNLSNSLNHPLSPSYPSPKPTVQPSKQSTFNQNFESIEKSFNETFSCLNGVSVQLIGNIRLQLTTPSNSNRSTERSSASGGVDVSLDRCFDKSNLNKLNNSLLMISECLKNDKQTTSSSPNSLSNSNDLVSKSGKEIDFECREVKSNKSFNIDKLIRDESKTARAFKFEDEDRNKVSEQLINQQLSASNDSSSSTLSAVSIDLSQTNLRTNIQQPSQPSLNFESNSNSTSRRRSSSSTASASSERDCLTPPNRKHLKVEPIVSPMLTSNQSLNLITSINSSMNLEPLPSPYLSPPSLPQQQLNDLLSPTDSLLKSKNSHFKLDRSSNLNKSNEDKHISPNFHKKFNAITSPKTTSNSTKNQSAGQPTTNRKPENGNENTVLNPKMRKILKSYQEIASNSLNGPEYYENLAMLANFHQQYGLRTLDPLTAKIASAASAFLQHGGPVPDAQLLMNELTKLQLNRSEDSKSEIASLSTNNLDNYLTKKSVELINSKSTPRLQTKNSLVKEAGKLSTTILENERISCFNVGGEERLCLPQILTTVLRSFTLHDINNVCDQFQIYCSRCNTEQLNMLKAANILPPGAPSCGLITKSDAERLCAMLFFYANLFPSQMQAKVKDPYSLFALDHLEKPQPAPEDLQPKLKLELKESRFILDLIKEMPDEIRQLVYEDHPLNRLQKIQALKTTLSFKVMHHCFGKCKGLLIPAFYLRYNSRCILCLECESLLSPHKFVLHTHKFNENQTCHWGFDSSNWRNLITLTKEDLKNPKMDILKKYLNEFKFHRIV